MDSQKAMDAIGEAYRDRKAGTAAASLAGKRTVGCLGSDVPEEILMAAGYTPVRVFGVPGEPTPAADEFLESAFDPTIRSQLERLLSGSYAGLDRLAVSNSSDSLVRVFYYIRHMRRAYPASTLPPTYFHDAKFSPFGSSASYNAGRAKAFVDEASSWNCLQVSDDELRAAMAACEENRKLLRKMAEYRRGPSPRIKGSEALAIIGASTLMPKDEFGRLLSAALSGLEARPALAALPLALSGSLHDEPSFYEAVERAGGTIACEDHDLGSRLYSGPEIELGSPDPASAIAEYYHLRVPSVKKMSIAQHRAALLAQVEESGAAGVVFYIRAYDDAASWDRRALTKALDEKGIPSLLLDKLPYSAESAAYGPELKVFIDGIKARRGGDGR